MNAVLVVVMVLLAGLALVIGGTGVAGLLGRLPGNGVLGVRTPETRRSPDAWRLANRAAGPAFLAAGIALGRGMLGPGLVGGWMGGLVVVVALLGALALLNVAGLAGARAAAVWQEAQDDDEAGCCSDGGCGGHGSTDSCGDSGTADPSRSAGEGSDPAADCGVGGGCGTCSLQGMCQPESASS